MLLQFQILYLKDIKKHSNNEEDSGFLYKETIYKLKGGN